MKIIYDLSDFRAINPVVTIGTFDGIHLGHQQVLNTLVETARKINGESVVFTFLQHPRSVLFPEDNSLKILTSVNEKIELIRKLGVDQLIIFPFTKEFSQLNSDGFIKFFLIDKIGMHTLVVGYDHQFGKDREGGRTKYEKLAKQYGYQYLTLGSLSINNENVSSTKIRNSLLKGDIQTANKFLGRCYSITGKVIEGEKLGRKIGFPTANLAFEENIILIPMNGVYAVKIEVNNVLLDGMLNIGVRPTINQAAIQSVEVNIFDFDKTIYGKNVKVLFHERIRDELKFESLEKLVNQLSIDKKNAQNILKNCTK